MFFRQIRNYDSTYRFQFIIWKSISEEGSDKSMSGGWKWNKTDNKTNFKLELIK